MQLTCSGGMYVLKNKLGHIEALAQSKLCVLGRSWRYGEELLDPEDDPWISNEQSVFSSEPWEERVAGRWHSYLKDTSFPYQHLSRPLLCFAREFTRQWLLLHALQLKAQSKALYPLITFLNHNPNMVHTTTILYL